MVSALRLFVKIFVPVKGVHFWQGCFFALATNPKFYKSKQVGLVHKTIIENASTVGCVLSFGGGFGVNVGRAHLRIPSECKTPKTYESCGFEHLPKTVKRGLA